MHPRFFTMMTHLSADLKATDASIPDEKQCMALQHYLQHRFDYSIVAIDTIDEDDQLTMELPKSRWS